jgi:pimeloyl-ACP methyl ester carboxylesterase
MKRTTLEEKYLDFDGCRVRYIDEGAGEPIVFLHGLGGKIEDNDACFPHLTGRFRVIAMDCPGTGWSDKPEREYDINYLVEFAFYFVSRLGIDRFFVVGGSQGGMHTLLCCLHSPERIKKAVVYSPSGVWPARPTLARLFRWLPPGAAKPLLHITSLFWNSPFYSGYIENRREALEFVDSREMPGFGMHVLGCLASQFERDYRELYATIDKPVLILWGQHDFGMNVRMGRELVTIIPGSQLIEVPRAGHNVSTEFPEFFAEKVSAFFQAG